MCTDRPATHVELRHNVGMLFMLTLHKSEGRLCRRCLGRAYRHHQVRNLTLGWWGFFSFFLTWLFLAGNTATYVSARWKLRGLAERERISPADAEARLQGFRANVLRRLGDGDPRDDIADDLAEATGVPPSRARAFVDELSGSTATGGDDG